MDNPALRVLVGTARRDPSLHMNIQLREFLLTYMNIEWVGGRVDNPEFLVGTARWDLIPHNTI